MRLKRNILAACVFAALSAFADITVSDVKVFSGCPWEEVVVGYTITGSTQYKRWLGVRIEDVKSNEKWEKIFGNADLSEGTHVLKWKTTGDDIRALSSNAKTTITIYDDSCLVIDLASGSSAKQYPISYTGIDLNHMTDEEYKTTKLVLRWIPSGSYMMQNGQRVVLTKPIYIGAFEVTQKQYELVMGKNPSRNVGEKRPVDKVSFEMIRGSSLGLGWPSSDKVDADSFMGRLQTRTGLKFDLTTEAQWEYACRAGR